MNIETPADFIEVQRECIAQVKFYIALAERKIGVRIPMPRVNFALTGGVAGRAYYRFSGNHEIRFNPKLLRENADDFLVQTTGHEVAHLAAHTKYGQIEPHGKDWQRCMWAFSLPANRCHNYDISERPVKRGPDKVRTDRGLIIKPQPFGRLVEFE